MYPPKAIPPAGWWRFADGYEGEVVPLSPPPLHYAMLGSVPGPQASRVDKPDIIPTFMELNIEGGNLYRVHMDICVCVCVCLRERERDATIFWHIHFLSSWPTFFLCTWENTAGTGSVVKGATWSICEYALAFLLPSRATIKWSSGKFKLQGFCNDDLGQPLCFAGKKTKAHRLIPKWLT